MFKIENIYFKGIYFIVTELITKPQKYLSKKMLKLFESKPVKLSPWDPMGALAMADSI